VKKGFVCFAAFALSNACMIVSVRAADDAPEPVEPPGRFLPVDLSPKANGRFERAVGEESITVAGVPFDLPDGGRRHLDLGPAQWISWKEDPTGFYSAYDLGTDSQGPDDPRKPMLRVPVADYVAAHLLAVTDDEPTFGDTVTLRVGRYGWSDGGQVIRHDFAAKVPRRRAAENVDSRAVMSTPAGPLFHVRVPFTRAFAQDIMEEHIDIEVTKAVRLARRRPDPCRFRVRPLGLPSGVRIAAITLERSPLQMRVGSDEPGHAFVQPANPKFTVTLRNVTASDQPYAVSATAMHLDGARTESSRKGKVAPGQTAEVVLELPVTRRGYHDLGVVLGDGIGRTVLIRRTSFALLPPDTRRHRDTSPFGSWGWRGQHGTSSDADYIGRLYVKLGFRYGMGHYQEEERQRFGLLDGNDERGMIFHEDSISGPHMMRVPDLFHDWPPYELDEEEKQRFKEMWDSAVKKSGKIRQQHTGLPITFGNGPLPLKEEFYRNEFPPEFFDAGGNEAPVFGRPPETQPPDTVALNASVWMDRQLLDGYGYEDKPVRLAYEICYPNDNPGNLDSRTQANYYVRHALHMLAWEMPFIHFGTMTDMGNTYHFGNWGGAGFCRRWPEQNVKPAYPAVATLTWILDGAKLRRKVPMGSLSLYGLEFELPDGRQVLAMWTIRGTYPVTLQFDADSAWTLVDSQANEIELNTEGKRIQVTLSDSPVYLVGKGKVASVHKGVPVYAAKPAGAVLPIDALDSLSNWTVEPGRNAELEVYNFLTPRRKGLFEFSAVAEFEGKKNILRVTPQALDHGKDTMPMYAALIHRQGVKIPDEPGKPTEIGLWVNGNSSWGRVIFELEDASGQRWISIGAQAKDQPGRWMQDWLPKEMLEQFKVPAQNDWNTNDVYGVSRINFEGWRYLGFPLPGNYPGERYGWPINSQWRSDKDGIVHYPLTFKKLIIELPEKTLHIKTYAPAPRKEIYLKGLIASYDPKADALWSDRSIGAGDGID